MQTPTRRVQYPQMSKTTMIGSVRNLVHRFAWRLKHVKVYALVGRSGTGKSFRAKLVSRKYGLDLIIDDGLLIKDEKILAGHSAKKERIYLKAIKTALFDDPAHRKELQRALDQERFKRVLIIGTSEKMVRRIAERLALPAPFKIIRIEDVATKDEIESAIRSRKHAGQHVIPVPAIEIARNYPHILYDSVRVFLKRGRFVFSKQKREFEKSVVRPQFGTKGKVSISEAALAQMVMHCADEFDSSLRIRKVAVKHHGASYELGIFLEVPYGVQLSGSLHAFQEYIVDNIQRYTGILLHGVDLNIETVSTPG